MQYLVSRRHSAGFTAIELLVVVCLMGIVLSIGVPNLSVLNSQMKAAQDIRDLAMNLAEIRAEAIRMRTDIKVTFSASGYSWDIGNDGSTEGTALLQSGCSWQGGTPSSVIFNGLGLVRGLSTDKTITIKNRSVSTSKLTLNKNGFIKL